LENKLENFDKALVFGSIVNSMPAKISTLIAGCTNESKS
jgi:hypothetical protein